MFLCNSEKINQIENESREEIDSKIYWKYGIGEDRILKLKYIV